MRFVALILAITGCGPSLDDVCDGTTGRAFVSTAIGSHEGTIDYDQSGVVTRFTLDVAYAGGSVSCESNFLTDGHFLTVDVQATVHTDDGTIAGAFRAQLRGSAGAVHLDGILLNEHNSGTYKPMVSGFDRSGVEIVTSISQTSMFGSVGNYGERTNGSSFSSSFIAFATIKSP